MDQLKKLIADLTLVQRVSIVAAVLIAGSALAALLHYRHEGDFRPLYTAMAPEDAAPVVQKLKESGVEYRLSDGGSVVLVPSSRLADSRLTLASVGLPKSGRIGFELFDKTNFGATELVEHINYQRALEGELERSVMSMAEVAEARVHLTFPRESVFLDQQQPAKASVMVKLRPGSRISTQNILAVSNLVASAVEGLNPDAVAVIDMNGTLLSRPRKAGMSDSQVTSESLEVRQQIERDLVVKINATLEPLLGADQVRAGASVDCDLTSGDQQEETYNPDQSVMVSSQTSEDTTERRATGGVPGTASNLPNPPEPTAAAGATNSHKTESTTYQTSRIIRHTRIPQGVIRRMSLSVLVGQPMHWEGSGKNRRRVFAPPPAETMKTIRELVAGVTGFNAGRGDQLIVETLPFESGPMADTTLSAPSAKPESQPAWLEMLNKNRTLLYMVVGGLVLIGVLIRIFLRFMSRRAPRPSVDVEQVTDELEITGLPREHTAGLAAESPRLLAEDHAETAERIRKLAERDPIASANVLRMWLQDRRA